MEAFVRLGPYFAVRREVDDSDWTPLADLDAEVLVGRVEQVRQGLSAVAGVAPERRVAASVLSLGLFARLFSPALAAAALGSQAPMIRLESVWWRPVESGPWPIAVTEWGDEPRPLEAVVDGAADALAHRIAATFALSRTVLDGNMASAVFGAVVMLRRQGADPRGKASALAEDALRTGALRGAGTADERGFVRSSCCLYYRIPGGGYCGDCVLADR